MLLAHAAARPDAPALREKDLGIWQATSWRRLRDEVEAIAAGLLAEGFSRGQHLALVGENRPRLYAAMIATQAIGGIPVPLYQDAVAHELVYVFQNAEIAFALVEDQEQTDKMLEVAQSHPLLRRIVYDDPRGLRNYRQPALLSFESLVARGAEYLQSHPGLLEEQVAQLSPDDAGSDVLHLRHHRPAEGRGPHASQPDHDVRCRFADGRAARRRGRARLPADGLDRTEHLLLFAVAGLRLHRKLPGVGRDRRHRHARDRPDLLFRAAAGAGGAADAGDHPHGRRGCAEAGALPPGDEGRGSASAAVCSTATAGVPSWDRLRYRLYDLLVYGPLRNALGMSRIRVAYTAGEAIGPDLFVFYRSLGINMKQLYGSTETAVFVCIQPNGQVRADTVGPALKGVELRITESGEVLIRSPGLLREYYKNPAATREVKDDDGWYHTGDAGYLDGEGHLKIIDRAKDVGRLADGSLFAPKYIENKLKFFPYIKEAVAYGSGRDQVMVLLNIDFEAVGNWAERRSINFAGYTDLASKPQTLELMRECVEKVNADLAADPVMASSQIHRFLVLHKELDADDEELTRTRKVRRGFIGDKYAVLVDALYAGKAEQFIETRVRFEDGRVGSVSSTIKLMDATTRPAAGAAAALQKRAA